MKVQMTLWMSTAALFFASVAMAQQAQGPESGPATSPENGSVTTGGQGQRKGQPRGGQRVSIEDRVARMSEELELTDEQAEEILSVMEQARESRPNVRMLDPEEAKPALCKHVLSTDAAIKDILTEEQGAEYDVFKESRRSRMGGGRGRGPMDCSEFESS